MAGVREVWWRYLGSRRGSASSSAGEEDNPDGNREGWEEDSESRRRKQQRSEGWWLRGRSWFLEEENVYMLGTGASEVFKRVKGGGLRNYSRLMIDMGKGWNIKWKIMWMHNPILKSSCDWVCEQICDGDMCVYVYAYVYRHICIELDEYIPCCEQDVCPVVLFILTISSFLWWDSAAFQKFELWKHGRRPH